MCVTARWNPRLAIGSVATKPGAARAAATLIGGPGKGPDDAPFNSGDDGCSGREIGTTPTGCQAQSHLYVSKACLDI
jgi:hypothetical protein